MGKNPTLTDNTLAVAHTSMDHQESPTFCESGKRRLVLEDFYKFYKSLDRKVAAKLFKEISSRLYARWHVIIIQKTIFYPLSIEKGGKGCVQKIILREITLKIRVMMWKFLNFSLLLVNMVILLYFYGILLFMALKRH